MTPRVTTLVERVNNKDEGVLRAARKGAEEERAFHRLQSKVYVFVKVFWNNGSERREEYGEFVDES